MVEETWSIGKYEFSCKVERMSSGEDKVNVIWVQVTDKKFGGPSRSGYIIEITISPQNDPLHDDLLEQTKRYIRKARKVKGDGFWETGIEADELDIIKDVKNILKNYFPEILKKAKKEKMLREAEERLSGLPEPVTPEVKNKNTQVDAGTKKATKKPLVGARNRDRTRKYAKLTISIVCVVAIIGVLVLGNGVIPFADITESFRGTNVQQCKVHDSFLITDSVSIQGKIYLEECNNVLTVSGNLNESARVTLTFLNPDKKPVGGKTIEKNEINYQIEKELHAKMTENGSIRVTVNGVPQGMLEFMQN